MPSTDINGSNWWSNAIISKIHTTHSHTHSHLHTHPNRKKNAWNTSATAYRLCRTRNQNFIESVVEKAGTTKRIQQWHMCTLYLYADYQVKRIDVRPKYIDEDQSQFHSYIDWVIHANEFFRIDLPIHHINITNITNIIIIQSIQKNTSSGFPLKTETLTLFYDQNISSKLTFV